MPGELFRAAAGLPDFAHLPYRCAATAIVDRLAGTVNALWLSFAAATKNIRDERLRALPVSSSKRAEERSGVGSSKPPLVETALQSKGVECLGLDRPPQR